MLLNTLFQSLRHPMSTLFAGATLTVMIAAGNAEAKNLGSYVGSIELSGTEAGPEVKYKARVNLNLPISERKDGSLSADFLAGEAPNGTLLLSQWDESYTQKSPGSDGKFSSYTCALAAPVEVPIAVTGVLDVDLKSKRHAFSITILSQKDVQLKCNSSRTGPYKKGSGLALTMGTGVPGEHYKTMLPFTDAARLQGKHTLIPGADTKGKYGPISQEWDFKLAQ